MENMNIKLNWSKYLFNYIKRRRKTVLIGSDIFATCRFNGKFIILNGLCLSIKSSKHFLLTSSISLLKKEGIEEKYFINFPIYLSGVINYKILGISYGFKINCSKLINVRLKK